MTAGKDTAVRNGNTAAQDAQQAALDTEPKTAVNIIRFDGTAGVASRLDYDVPQPAQHDGRRLIELADLDVSEGDWTDAAKEGADLAAEIGLTEKPASGGAGTAAAGDAPGYELNGEKALDYWMKRARASGVPGDEIAAVEKLVDEAAQQGPDIVINLLGENGRQGLLPAAGQDAPEGVRKLGRYVKRLREEGVAMIPEKSWAGGVAAEPVPIPVGAATPKPQPRPTLFLVEVYGVTSQLGNFGLGQVVKTVTLFPGEKMKISTKTWTSSEIKQTEASSIVDSFNKTAAEKFKAAVQHETTDKKTQATKHSWHVEADVHAVWGWGAANVKGGGAGEYHSGREEFAKQVNDTVQEHASEASSKRETTVTSSSERVEKSGEETATERTIENVNLRRTLNIVFRLLNQAYEVKVHLKEVRLGFNNGLPDSWREVPLSGMRDLLHDVLKPQKADEVAQKILKHVSVVFDASDRPVPVLEKFTVRSDGQVAVPGEYPARPGSNGEYPVPSAQVFYRYRRGKLGQDQVPDRERVDGVVMKSSKLVMKTDSLVGEALLGQADALDPYAIDAQRAESEAKELANERERIAQAALKEIDNPEKRADAYDDMFNEETVVVNGHGSNSSFGD